MLSILFRMDSFVCGVFDSDKRLLGIDVFDDIKVGEQATGALNEKYGDIEHVRAIYMTSPFVHSSDQHDKVLDFLEDFNFADRITDVWHESLAYTHYGLPRWYESNVAVEKRHLSTCMLACKSLEDEVLHLFFASDELVLFYKKNGRIVFYNSFSCKAKEDYLYWTTAVIQYLKKDPHAISVQLSGDIGMQSPIVTLLKEYILSVEKLPIELSIADARYERMAYMFLPHYINSTCE